MHKPKPSAKCQQFPIVSFPFSKLLWFSWGEMNTCQVWLYESCHELDIILIPI